MSAPQQFRKKPVVITAVQWTGDNFAEVAALLQIPVDLEHEHSNGDHDGAMLYVVREEPHSLAMRTVHGEVALARVNDWVIPEPVPGRGYPCKPDIFAATYDVVDSPQADDDRPRTAPEHITAAQELSGFIGSDRWLKADERATGPTDVALAQMHALIAIALLIEESHRPLVLKQAEVPGVRLDDALPRLI